MISKVSIEKNTSTRKFLYTPLVLLPHLLLQGRSKVSPTAVPSRFADEAPLFFFPLMTSYDRPQGTLDLLGQDSLVLGNLLYTLGTVMYAANNSPLAPAMGVALLDFTWALRYHSAV